MIEKIVYLRIAFRLASPMIIGSGKNINTDNDIARDSRGIPFIPGSAVAGVTRSALEEKLGKGIIQKYFGFVDSSGKNDDPENKESSVMVYDAEMDEKDRKKYVVSHRDGVGLDEYKNAVAGAKFDMEAVEPGIRFVTYIRHNVKENEDAEFLQDAADAWLSDRIIFGAKGSRGYGAIEDVSVKKMTFDIGGDPQQCEQDVLTWLDFDMYDETCWERAEEAELSENAQDRQQMQISLGLELQGGISIRQYTSGIGSEDGHLDYRQLSLAEGDPVIPGTSWAGAFRHAMEKITKGSTECFGKVRDSTKEKSLISFSESRIKGSVTKAVSRTSIDRFSGAAKDGALFTEETEYGGETELKISFRKAEESRYSTSFINTLSAACADLHEGFLAVGGETSIGRGIFKVRNIDGETFTGDGEELYGILRDKLEVMLK